MLALLLEFALQYALTLVLVRVLILVCSRARLPILACRLALHLLCLFPFPH